MDEIHNIGSFLTLREAIRVMKEQEPRAMPLSGRKGKDPSGRNMSRGSIVMISSIAAKGGGQAIAGYISAKHAVDGLVKAAGKKQPTWKYSNTHVLTGAQ